MKMPAGYDEWRLNPPEADAVGCDWCGDWRELRVLVGKADLIVCANCFSSEALGPCFDDLDLAEEYFAEQEADRGDYLFEQRKDRDI